ncbi:hypothetical protein QYE76_070012 [Lolium multiflorum]|uniref:CCHC-type domain-containing protein n=1 Tax=Lolium multiflorum TaxID=4521 RepID=A0AAD8SHG3_LOLMU|nr:hypothetical protein QYE76_070012 [Lolium multiflorum]
MGTTTTPTLPEEGSNAIPVTPKDKSTVNCYECGVVGHYSNECPKKLAKIAANTAAPAQQQRRFAGRRNQNNNNGRFYLMTANEAQEAPQIMPTSRTHGIGHQTHAQYLATACQTRGERAKTTHWTPQYISSPGRARPPLPLHLRTRDHHAYGYLLDILDSSRKH